jgi:hypothetical protein
MRFVSAGQRPNSQLIIMCGDIVQTRLRPWLYLPPALLLGTSCVASERPSQPFLSQGVAPIVHATSHIEVSTLIGTAVGSAMRLLDVADSTALLQQRKLQCLRSADIRIEYQAHEGHMDTVTVRCRPIAGIQFRGTPPVMLNGAPTRIVLEAKDPQGNAISELSGRILTDDTTIFRISGDTIFPKRIGTSWIRVEVGDCTKFMAISVKDTVSSPLSVETLREFNRAFSLSPEEYLALPLPQGWLGITATSYNDTGNLELRVVGANCAKLSRAANDLSCVVDSAATALIVATRVAVTGDIYIRSLANDSLTSPRPSRRLRNNKPGNEVCPWILR